MSTNKGRGKFHTKKLVELSAEQKKEAQAAFDLFDPQNTGEIPLRDLKVAMRSMGFEPSKEEISQLIKEFDCVDTVSLAQFLEMMAAKMNEKDTREEILKAFRMFDAEEGHITLGTLKKVAEELGETISEEELKEMITEADLDGDNAVNEEEFLRIMKKTNLY